MQRLNAIPSERLMARYQQHLDAEAFEEIVARFLPPALAAARQFIADISLAEDAVQETFLRGIRCRGQYRASRPFSCWFYAILRNVCKDMLLGRSRREKAMREFSLRTEAPAQEPILDAEDPRDLLARIPAQARAVVILRIVHDLSFAEIASLLGISEEAAKKRAQRALRRLRSSAPVSSAETA